MSALKPAAFSSATAHAQDADAFRPAKDGRKVWLLLFGLALPTAAAVGRVFVGTDALRLGYALSEQQARHRTQVGKQRELQAELAAAVAPARLVELGQAWKLGPPAPAQIMVGLPVAVPRPASAQQAPAPVSLPAASGVDASQAPTAAAASAGRQAQ